MNNTDKIITVVGGTGFVGRYVVELLAARGYQVRVIARDVTSDARVKTAGNVGQIKLVSGDITKPESLKDKLKGSYAVVNLVGILFQKGRETFDAVQAKGAGELAMLAKASGAKRFVHVSAIGADANSSSGYAKTKAAGEQAVKAAFPASVILRPSIIFGAEDNFFNKFATMLSFTPFLPLIGGGATKFQPVYVGDVAEAVCVAIENESACGKTYELGGPNVMRFCEVLEFIGNTTRRNPVFFTLPYGIAGIMGCFAGLLPNPPLTADQVKLLKSDNVVTSANTLASLGITAQSPRNIVPSYLARYARKVA